MHRGDANSLLWRLRDTRETEKIPVFVMSGREPNQTTETNLSKTIPSWPGAIRIFKKPFDVQELFNALRKYCSLQEKPG